MYSEFRGFVVGRAISRAEEEQQTMSGGGRRSELKRSSGIHKTERWKLYEMISLKRKDGSGRYDWSLCATTRIFKALPPVLGVNALHLK